MVKKEIMWKQHYVLDRVIQMLTHVQVKEESQLDLALMK